MTSTDRHASLEGSINYIGDSLMTYKAAHPPSTDSTFKIGQENYFRWEKRESGEVNGWTKVLWEEALGNNNLQGKSGPRERLVLLYAVQGGLGGWPGLGW